MKALAIMFVMLTVINLPLIIIYADNTQHNNYLRLSEFFKYFTIGNLGQTDSTCGYSSVNFANANGVFYPDSESRQVMNLTCDEDYYIDGIKHFGFLYHIDRQTKGISTGPSWCDHVKNPEAKRIKIEKKDREKVSRVDVVGNDEIDQKELLDT